MKRAEDTSGQVQRYIGVDVHKHYITVGGMNRQQELVLRLRNVEMDRFKRWAEENLRSTDEVVLESSTNTWDIYDTVAPLVKGIVVAHPAEVKQIANAWVKTDNQDVIRFGSGSLGATGGGARVEGPDLVSLAIGDTCPGGRCQGDGDGDPEPHAQSFASS